MSRSAFSRSAAHDSAAFSHIKKLRAAASPLFRSKGVNLSREGPLKALPLPPATDDFLIEIPRNLDVDEFIRTEIEGKFRKSRVNHRYIFPRTSSAVRDSPVLLSRTRGKHQQSKSALYEMVDGERMRKV